MNKLQHFEQSVLENVQVHPPVSVAIIGIGCRFPGGINGPKSYWNFLLDKSCGIVEIPSDRWNAAAYFDPDPDAVGKTRSKWGGFLQDDVFGFDPAFFDMSPREAMSMDPQQRLLLQVAYETVQDAGTTVETLQRARTGVFVGISTSDFGYSQRYRRNSQDIFAGTGSALSIAANRISHRFDLNGPSLAIDTACSSALVAVDQAIRHLSMDTCDMALAGGVNCLLEPGAFIAFSGANMLSPTGAIYTFDERANGFVRGEGCGLVLLKPLTRAIKDQDRIYGIIRGTSVNQDGRTPTLTGPSDAAQAAMLEYLISTSGIDPEDVGFVEAHGTGTLVGDPVEARAIGRVFGSRRVDRPVAVGSFKPNLGHLESASGIAGLIKVALSVHHGIIAPNRNFERPNPYIPFDALGIKVPVEPEPLEDKKGVALAVVNSFGFGGTNASVAMESWRAMSRPPHIARRPIDAHKSPVFIPISAGSKSALRLWAARLADTVDDGGPLEHVPYEQIAANLKLQRDHFTERAVILAEPDRRDLPAKLRSVGSNDEVNPKENHAGPTIIAGRAAKNRRLAFAFSGQGGQWWAMGRRLLLEEPLYRRTVETFDEVFRPIAGWSAVEEMLRPEVQSRINDPDTTQAAIFANQIGLYELWKAQGLTPELLIGHSFGEVAATYIADVLDLETAARIIYYRGLIPNQSTRRGAMAAIGLTIDQLAPLLPNDESVVVAASNGPTAQTISGMEDAVLAVLAEVAKRHPDALARRHTMNFGWHGPHLDDCEAWFRGEVGETAWKNPKIPIVSTVTGQFETRFDHEYWWQNLRQPVSFKKAIDFCLDLGIDTFLEFGPHRTLTPLVHGIAQERGAPVIAVTSLDRTADEFWTMARSMATLYVAGVSFDWSAPGHEEADKSITLPRTPWANERLLQLPLEARKVLFDAPRHPLLGWREIAPEPTWTNDISLKGFKYLADHRVSGDCLFPAVGYVEMMVAALREQSGEGPVELRDVKLLEALSVGDDDSIIMRTTFDPVTHRLRISSLRRDSDEEWRLRAQAYGWRHEFSLQGPSFDPTVFDRSPSIEHDEFYKLTALHGLEYGPTFQAIQDLWIVADEYSICRIRSSEAEVRRGYVAFPGLLDAVLQSCVPLGDKNAGLWEPGKPLPDLGKQAPRYPLRLPIGIRKIFVAGALPSDVVAEFRAFRHDSSGTFRVYTPDGTPLLAIENLYTKALGGGRQSASSQGSAPAIVEEHFVRVAKVGAPTIKSAAVASRWLLIADDAEATGPLSAALRRNGVSVETLPIAPLAGADSDAAEAAIEALCHESEGLSGVIFAASSDSRIVSAADLPTDDFLAAVEGPTVALVSLGRVFDRMRAAQKKPMLVVLTRGGRRVPEDGPMLVTGLASSALVGLTRTIANECPEFVVRQVDADGAAFADAEDLAATVLEEGPEAEVVLRGTVRYVPRLEHKAIEVLTPRKRRISTRTDASNYMVTMTSPGVIDNIVLRETDLPVPAADEVVVEVAAVGLNFRDIMVATSILPDEIEGEGAWWRNLGLEFAGTVRAVGEDVDRLKIGDRIMGMGKGFLRRYARLQATIAIPVPDDIDLVAAATIPAAFMTAHYALDSVARLAKDEKVLVHLATGGVGLAAIQVARYIGAEILGTAGSDRKRSYLRELGITHVMNSRSLDFAEEVRAKTNGRGVDVVLNALSGAAIDKGLECLAPFGRFVEIGKRDLADDKPIGLRSLYCNNSYSVIDLSTLGTERPDLLRRLLAEVGERVARTVYRPLEFTTFPASRVADAMRMLAKAQHIGKVVVTFDEPEVDVELDLAKPMVLSRDASYLVTGGLRGFGVAVADWLSKCGAGRLLLVGRAGVVDPAAQPTIDAIASRGTEIVTAAVDVTDCEAVLGLVASHAHSDKPLRGIIHGAAVIQDGFLSQLDRAQIEKVIRPKVAGAWNLHRAATLAGAELDFFVSFSSLAQLIGSPGQANYTAANSVLNAMASFRRSRGLPASTIAWGAIGGSGFVARSEALGSYLDSIGMKTIADTDAAAALDRLLRADNENLTFAGVDWSAVTRAMPRAHDNPRLKPLLLERVAGRSRIQAELAAAPRAAWEGMLSDLIRGEVAKVLKVDASAIPTNRKLSELGLDSLSSFELKNRIEAQIDINIPVAKFLQTPTVSGLSGVVANAVDAMLKAQAAAHAASRAGGTGGSVIQADRDAFRPLSRQIAAATLAVLPMTSAMARADCEIAAHIVCDSSFDFDNLATALAQLASVQGALRLTVGQAPDGGIEVRLGDAPQLERIERGDDLFPISAEKSLWRFGATSEEGQFTLYARAHRAAADALSPFMALAALIETAKNGMVSAPQTSLDRFTEDRRLVEGSPNQTRHLAFWKEVLRLVPPALPQHGRSRALAPVRFGINRGPIGYLQTEIAAPEIAALQPDEQEAVLAAAFARAIALVHGTSVVVVERHDEARRDAGPIDLIGPIADSFPLLLDNLAAQGEATIRRARRALALGRDHRAMDTAAIESALEKDLRERNAALRQIGFCFIDAESMKRMRAFDFANPPLILANSFNEVRLDVAAHEAGIQVCLGVDTDVVNRAYAEAVVDVFAQELETCLMGETLAPAMIIAKPRWTEPQTSHAEKSLPAVPQARSVDAPIVSAPALGGNVREIPVSTLQSSMLRSLLRPDASSAYRSYWSPSRAYRIKPHIDVMRLKRAFTTLTERHEALRTRFVVADDGSIRALLEVGAQACFNLENMEGKDEATVLGRVAELSTELIDPFCDPLYQVTVLRCGDGSDIMHFKVHRAVIDAWSLAMLLEEMFQTYMGMSLAPVEMTTEDYVRLIDKTTDPDTQAKRDAYLRSLYAAPSPQLPKLGRVARGLAPNLDMVQAGGARELVAYCTPEGERRLQDRARSSGTTETSLLIAAYAQTLASRGGVDEVITTVPVAMRTEQRMNNFIGFLAGYTLLRAPVSASPTLEALAVGLGEQLGRSMEYAPFNYAIRDGALHEEIIKLGSYFALYWTGMRTADRFSRGAATKAIQRQRLGNSGVLDFGMVKIAPVKTPGLYESAGACELDIRSFQGPEGLAYRCGYDQLAFDQPEAQDIFGEVLDRLGLGDGGSGPIVATDDE